MRVLWVSRLSVNVGRDLERRVLGRVVLGACGRYESECLGWTNFSDAPSLDSARSMQHKRSASRKAIVSESVSRKCMHTQYSGD